MIIIIYDQSVQDKQQIYNIQQTTQELDQFLQTFNNQSTNPFLRQAITQDQLLAQNARLLQQLHEQQRMLNFQNLFTQSVLQNPFINSQITHESKKIKKTKSTLQRIQSNASIKEQTPQIQEIKGNVKNAYIKKITSLLSVEGEKLLDEELQEDLQGDSSSEEVSKEQKFGLAGLLGSTNDLLNVESKNKPLRQSAKNSRLRKKVYLKLLEKKVQDLDQKISEYKKTTRQSFEYLTQILTSHPILNSMIIGNSSVIDQIIQCKQSDQAQLILDSYLMRYGTCGIKRRDYLKYAVKNIQRNFLKGNYGLQLISFNKDVKNYDDEFNEYVEIVKKQSKLDDENLIYKVLPIIDKLLNHRKISQQYFHLFQVDYYQNFINLRAITLQLYHDQCIKQKMIIPAHSRQYLQSICSQDLWQMTNNTWLKQILNFQRNSFVQLLVNYKSKKQYNQDQD